MKRIMLFLVFTAVSVFLTGCYTQFVIPQRNYDDDKYVQRDDRDLYEKESELVDSLRTGYKYYDDYRDYQFHYYSPIYSRFFWGYYPGRIAFYDYGNWWDNMWAYGWYNDPFYYDFYWHMGSPWNNYYYWPYYYPRYYGDYWYGWGSGSGSSYLGYNAFPKERRNDGERLTGRSSFDRLGGSRTSLSGTSGFGRVVVGRNSGNTSSTKEGDRSGSTTSSGTRTRTGEKIYRDYNEGRTRSADATRITTPSRLKEYTPPESSGSRSSSDRSSGRVTTGSGYDGGNYSNPNRSGSSNNSGSVGRSSSGSSSSSSGTSSRGSSSSGSSSSGSSRGNEGGGRSRGR